MTEYHVENHEILLEQQHNLIMTCDGIHDYVNATEMKEILSQNKDIKQVIQELEI